MQHLIFHRSAKQQVLHSQPNRPREKGKLGAVEKNWGLVALKSKEIKNKLFIFGAKNTIAGNNGLFMYFFFNFGSSDPRMAELIK